jgi:hypothetical protein
MLDTGPSIIAFTASDLPDPVASNTTLGPSKMLAIPKVMAHRGWYSPSLKKWLLSATVLLVRVFTRQRDERLDICVVEQVTLHKITVTLWVVWTNADILV